MRVHKTERCERQKSATLLSILSRVFVVIPLLLQAPNATAGEIYSETLFGLSKISGGNSYFGSASSGASSPSFAFAGTLAANLGSNSNSLIHVHLGGKLQYNSTTSASSLSIAALYPLIRLEFPRFYLGGGVSPFIWLNPSSGGSGFSKPTSVMGYYGEAGIIWRVVYFFAITFEGSMQSINMAKANSSNVTSYAGYLGFRFSIFNATQSTGKRYGDFDGWRYPFGIEL